MNIAETILLNFKKVKEEEEGRTCFPATRFFTPLVIQNL